MPCGGLQKVGAAHDIGDLHFSIIDYNRQLICRHIVAAPDYEVAEIMSSHERLRSEMTVNEFDYLSVRRAKTPVHARRRVEIGCVGARAASARINRLIVGLIGRAGCLRQIFARARARKDEAAIAKLAPYLQIVRTPLALGVWRIRSAAVRAFAPVNSESMQVFDHGFGKFRLAALWIQIFIPKG